MPRWPKLQSAIQLLLRAKTVWSIQEISCLYISYISASMQFLYWIGTQSDRVFVGAGAKFEVAVTTVQAA